MQSERADKEVFVNDEQGRQLLSGGVAIGPFRTPLLPRVGLSRPAAPLPMVTAALGCVPLLRSAAASPQIWVSVAPVFARDAAKASRRALSRSRLLTCFQFSGL